MGLRSALWVGKHDVEDHQQARVAAQARREQEPYLKPPHSPLSAFSGFEQHHLLSGVGQLTASVSRRSSSLSVASSQLSSIAEHEPPQIDRRARMHSLPGMKFGRRSDVKQ